MNSASPVVPQSLPLPLDIGMSSIFLYFFLVLETASLKRAGSSLVTDFLSGRYPKRWTKALKHVCRWAKCVGSVQGELE